MVRLNVIRQKILDRDYYISAHAEEEMLNDNLERSDIENAILKGSIEKKLKTDSRGIRYRIEGPAEDNRQIYVIARIKEDKELIIITVYEPEE